MKLTALLALHEANRCPRITCIQLIEDITFNNFSISPDDNSTNTFRNGVFLTKNETNEEMSRQ
jgi:hypothetical protein